MSLHVLTEKRHNKVVLKSGHFYTFKYKSFENDPEPLIIFINAISGIHENTGNQHRYIQGINLNYVPKKDRKKFMETYLKANDLSKGDIKFTWKIIKRKYPYISFAIRRYFYIPNYYITNLQEIPQSAIIDAVNSNVNKDFSKKVKVLLNQKIKQLKGKTKK